MDELEKLELELDCRGLSKKTKKSYSYFVKDFLKFIKKEIPQIQERDIKKYLRYLIIKKHYTNITANLAISSLKFFFGNVLKKDICKNIKRPKRENKLPTVLSKEEVKKIINSANNTKHKLVLKCLYGLGLRVSELVNLEVNNIDFERNVVKILGKGNKQRYVMLPEKLKPDLRNYIALEQHQKYLFLGRNNKYSIKAVQKIFEYAAKKANIKKKVSCHTLRHSFATHLLEKGINIRYIQTLLGHSRLQTTQIYTHVANSKLKNIQSPLDDL